MRLINKKVLPLTPAKPQAATQAITPSFRPRPSYPLGASLEAAFILFPVVNRYCP